MSEKLISLEDINQLELFGAQNKNINYINSFFPNLKIVARGNELKVIGNKDNIENFEQKFNKIIQYLEQYRSINNLIIEKLIIKENPKIDYESEDKNIILYGNYGKIIKVQTPNQKRLLTSSKKNDLIFAIGPAGSGKTYTAVALAVQALKENQVKRIILTRPAVEAGERLGFLPGDYKEKLDPYLRPLYDALNDMLSKKKVEKYIEEGIIEIAPLAFMRGRTLDNAYVILDEAQNTTHGQLKMFLTRMGRNAKFIINGDITQIDLPHNTKSGLFEAMDRLKDVKGIDFIYLNDQDIIRHELVSKIVEAYK